jgi:hypothetical protein
METIKSVSQWIQDWNRDCVSIGLPPISREEKLEMMRMRNLMIIAARNNWSSALAMAIFPSNR